MFKSASIIIHYIIIAHQLCKRAAAVEEELKNIADRQHYNVDKLVDLVKENQEILDQMKVRMAP